MRACMRACLRAYKCVSGVPGWLNDSQDNAWKVWDTALCDATSDGGDALALRFDTRVLYNLGITYVCMDLLNR